MRDKKRETGAERYWKREKLRERERVTGREKEKERENVGNNKIYGQKG